MGDTKDRPDMLFSSEHEDSDLTGLEVERSTISDAYLSKWLSDDTLGVLFYIKYDGSGNGGACIRTTMMENVNGLMGSLGAESSMDLIGKQVIAYIGKEDGREVLVGISKYDYSS